MKNRLLLPIGILALSCLTACGNDNESTTTTSDTTTTMTATTETTGGMHTLSENDTYTDLKTGKTFRIRRDAATGTYLTETGERLDDMYLLNPNTRDTFYGSSGRWVNNALNYDAEAGNYSVDEARWNEMNAQGGGMAMEADKIKMTDEEFKAKSEDGEQKVKITDDETKIKSGDDKIKVNEDQTKIKSGNMKVKATEDEVKIKQR